MDVVWPQPEAPHYAVPNSWNFSRFLSNLIAVETEQGLLSRLLSDLREQLMEVLPDLVNTWATMAKPLIVTAPDKSMARVDTVQIRMPIGHHETAGVNIKNRHSLEESEELVWLWSTPDSRHPLRNSVAFHLTPASHSEQVELRAMLDELFEQTPELAERCADFSADRGLDCAETKAKLWDEHHIRPLIDTRELWRSEKQAPNYEPGQPITRPLYPDRADTIVYTEKGTVHCICLATGMQRDLAFQGFETDRNTLNIAVLRRLMAWTAKAKPNARRRASESGRLWTHCPHRHH